LQLEEADILEGKCPILWWHLPFRISRAEQFLI
jgi:hypothetical protein